MNGEVCTLLERDLTGCGIQGTEITCDKLDARRSSREKVVVPLAYNLIDPRCSDVSFSGVERLLMFSNRVGDLQ